MKEHVNAKQGIYVFNSKFKKNGTTRARNGTH